ncbi:unnamed protein product [Haemonchus placei]|uniref:Transmembrane protein n=1 Tax=Haemonchus placei TaxID=6290 RepID=A0A158QPD1_HAEPC|nr:unnamed protein product [Haemonchus placei]
MRKSQPLEANLPLNRFFRYFSSANDESKSRCEDECEEVSRFPRLFLNLYFSSANDESKSRCEDECEEVYYSFFTYGKCVGDIFGKLPRDQQPACNLRCGVRPRIWTTVGLFCVFAAALATLLFTIPMCIATCASCLHAKKANKNAKRVMMEQQAQPSKDQQVATMGYNPYAYWPYYGRA